MTRLEEAKQSAREVMDEMGLLYTEDEVTAQALLNIGLEDRKYESDWQTFKLLIFGEVRKLTFHKDTSIRDEKGNLIGTLKPK